MEPLSTKLASDFSWYYVPATNVSVDEMIIQFSGRSSHTVRMKNKPTPEGYKIFALCEAGYTYSFLYSSCIHSNIGINNIQGLTATASAVVHLAQALPYQQHPFNIYMDNYFSNVPLFKYLCSLNIGACGTVCINSSRFPPQLKVAKSTKLPWNTLSGAIVDNLVLTAVWMDNAPVTMLSTIHQISGKTSFVERIWRQPRVTSTNAHNVRSVFNGQHTAKLSIPKIINDYNFNMNGVNISDQYRSYYGTQLPVFRTWLPLFFWILDTTVFNTYHIHKAQGGQDTHKDFRIKLAWDLIHEGAQGKKRTWQHHQGSGPKTPKRVYVTKSHETLPVSRLSPGCHPPVSVEGRPSCILCHYRANVLNDPNFKIKTPTMWKCSKCNVPLCLSTARNCFNEYHEIQEF